MGGCSSNRDLLEIIRDSDLGGLNDTSHLLAHWLTAAKSSLILTAAWARFYLRYLSKVHSSIPACTKQVLRNSSLTGQYLFDEQLVSGAVDKLQGDVSLISNTHMLDRLSSARGGYQSTKRAGAKRQAPQAMAQVDSSFQKKAKPQQPFHGQQPFRGQGKKAKSKPGSYNRGRGRGAGKSSRGDH